MLSKPEYYAWRIGDVFTDGTHRWAVDSILGEKAILRSCGSSWATTIALTFSEWREGGRWRLEAPKVPKQLDAIVPPADHEELT